jgi:hypothetical protein
VEYDIWRDQQLDSLGWNVVRLRSGDLPALPLSPATVIEATTGIEAFAAITAYLADR